MNTIYLLIPTLFRIYLRLVICNLSKNKLDLFLIKKKILKQMIFATNIRLKSNFFFLVIHVSED